jgi:hypothetical protein
VCLYRTSWPLSITCYPKGADWPVKRMLSSHDLIKVNSNVRHPIWCSMHTIQKVIPPHTTNSSSSNNMQPLQLLLCSCSATPSTLALAKHTPSTSLAQHTHRWGLISGQYTPAPAAEAAAGAALLPAASSGRPVQHTCAIITAASPHAPCRQHSGSSNTKRC